MKYNQFEDLLSITDLSISSVFVSTTNWQSISKKIPSISYSRYNIDTFMNEFNYLLVDENKINEAIKYWLNIDKREFDNFLYNFKPIGKKLYVYSLVVMLILLILIG